MSAPEIIDTEFEVIEPGARELPPRYHPLTERLSLWIGYGVAGVGFAAISAFARPHLQAFFHRLFSGG